MQRYKIRYDIYLDLGSHLTQKLVAVTWFIGDRFGGHALTRHRIGT